MIHSLDTKYNVSFILKKKPTNTPTPCPHQKDTLFKMKTLGVKLIAKCFFIFYLIN